MRLFEMLCYRFTVAGHGATADGASEVDLDYTLIPVDGVVLLIGDTMFSMNMLFGRTQILGDISANITLVAALIVPS